VQSGKLAELRKLLARRKQLISSPGMVQRPFMPMMRMGMRRFTRLTNAFSKKVENLAYAVSLHFMYYNFVRIHKTLRVSPAMEAKVTDRLWDIEDIVRLL